MTTATPNNTRLTIGEVQMKPIPLGASALFEAPGGGTVSKSVESFDADKAKAALATNNSNRPVRVTRVERYARAILDGKFLFNGESVIFDDTGRMINGQHRMHAVVQANETRPGVTFTTSVTRGVQPETYSSMDAGIGRNVGDVLHSMGVGGYANTKAAAAKMVLGYQAESLLKNREMTIIGTVANVATEVTSTDEYTEALELMKTARPKFMNFSSLIAFRVLAGRTYGADPVFEVKLAEFIDRTFDGINLAAGDARLALRSWASNNYGSNTDGNLALFAIIRAWNNFLTGESVRMLRISKTGDYRFARLPELAAV